VSTICSRLQPDDGQVIMRVQAANGGPRDAWVRAGKSALPRPLPLILGPDLFGIVESIGPDVPIWTLEGQEAPPWRVKLRHYPRSHALDMHRWIAYRRDGLIPGQLQDRRVYNQRAAGTY
jgi:hypothetical protein